jgi:aminomethyltransferase
MANGEAVGEVKSGSFAPSLGYAVAAGYLRQAFAGEGQELEIEVRGTNLKARVVSMPFYKNGTARKNRVVTSKG